MRYLGIDFGLKRIGLAISDPAGTLALPYKTISKKNNEQLFKELLSVIKAEDIEGIVLGLPKDLEGRETLSTRQVQNFIKRIKRITTLPVYQIDETLSSKEAENRLKEAGLPAGKIKKYLDQEAAAVILESFLKQMNSFSQTGPETSKKI